MCIRNTHYTKSKQKPKQTQNNAYLCEYVLVAGFSDKKTQTQYFSLKILYIFDKILSKTYITI